MKIEGLGERGGDIWGVVNPRTGGLSTIEGGQRSLTPEKLKVGLEIGQQTGTTSFDKWIITDVLGDGKFKAVPKNLVSELAEPKKVSQGLIDKAIKNGRDETFDISGKVDENNPIFKFYESEIGKYLKNKYGAKRLTDQDGEDWWLVTVDPKAKDLPIEAFAALPAAAALGATESDK